MFINLEEMRADLLKYGNMPLLDYIAMKRNIAKYGQAAVKFYETKAVIDRYDRMHAALAAQFGMTVEEYKKQLKGG